MRSTGRYTRSPTASKDSDHDARHTPATTPAIVLHAFGDPTALHSENVPLAAPAAGEVQLRQTGIGVNFIDTYFRRGIYPLALPAVLGEQGTGVVEAVGPEVSGFAVGERVAYGACSGAYAARRNIRAEVLVKLPADVADDVVSASLLRGLTAEYLLCRLHAIVPGETVVVHAAGGTGLIVCQWARHLGARVIATVARREGRRRAGRRRRPGAAASVPTMSSRGFAISPTGAAPTWSMTRSGATPSMLRSPACVGGA